MAAIVAVSIGGKWRLCEPTSGKQATDQQEREARIRNLEDDAQNGTRTQGEQARSPTISCANGASHNRSKHSTDQKKRGDGALHRGPEIPTLSSGIKITEVFQEPGWVGQRCVKLPKNENRNYTNASMA